MADPFVLSLSLLSMSLSLSLSGVLLEFCLMQMKGLKIFRRSSKYDNFCVFMRYGHHVSVAYYSSRAFFVER